MENSEALTPESASSKLSLQENYREKCNKEILPRKEELLKRFPDFVPSFSLQKVGEELEYSFHLVPVTEKGIELKEHLPNFFPVLQDFRPIEMMWREDTGATEIDIFLSMFPSQVSLEKGVKEKKKEARKKAKIKEARIVLAKIGILTIIFATMNILSNAGEKSSPPTACERNNQTSGVQR